MNDLEEEILIEEKICSLIVGGETRRYEDKLVATLQGSFSMYDSRVLKNYCLRYSKFTDETEGFELYTQSVEFDRDFKVILGPMRMRYGKNFEKNGRRRFTGDIIICDDYVVYIIGFIEKYLSKEKL